LSGYFRERRGENHHAVKMTGEQVRELRRLVHGVGLCVPCAGKLLEIPVHTSTLWDAANYVTWRHVAD
tara:strand:+ start:1035 stop:1238 length:204 start_codon:yes stop_codon:yes gene_type:complete